MVYTENVPTEPHAFLGRTVGKCVNSADFIAEVLLGSEVWLQDVGH